MQDTNFIDLLDAFHEQLDNLYHSRYALELLEENEAAYDFYFDEVRNQFTY